MSGAMFPKGPRVLGDSDICDAMTDSILIILMLALRFVEWIDNCFLNYFAFVGHFG